MLTFIGNGSAESFENTGDMTDLAVMINYDNNRSLLTFTRMPSIETQPLS